jgi:gliding motility associated protien GldN
LIAVKTLLLTSLLGTSLFMHAQLICPYTDVFGKIAYGKMQEDKFYRKNYVKPVPHDSLPEQEIVVAKQLIKSIDLTDKTNKALFSNYDPKNGMVPFFEVLKFGVVKNKIRTFKDNKFQQPKIVYYTCDQFIKRIVVADSIDEVSIDADGVETNRRIFRADTIKYSAIKSLSIDEVWYFNKKYARLEKRIIGIGPVWHNPKTNKDENLFWIYYEEARDLFASFANNCNATGNMWKTYDQIFMLRFFNCYILKEYNLYDRNKLDNGKALDDLLESERAKEKIVNGEDGMWTH